MILTTAQAAERLGVTDAHVRRLVIGGRLRATRLGERAWMIAESDLARVRLRPRGRQPKTR